MGASLMEKSYCNRPNPASPRFRREAFVGGVCRIVSGMSDVLVYFRIGSRINSGSAITGIVSQLRSMAYETAPAAIFLAHELLLRRSDAARAQGLIGTKWLCFLKKRFFLLIRRPDLQNGSWKE